MNNRLIILSVVILLVFDFLWIGLFMGNQYKKQIITIQNSEMKVDYKFAFMAYVLMVFGLILFVYPILKKEVNLEIVLYTIYIWYYNIWNLRFYCGCSIS